MLLVLEAEGAHLLVSLRGGHRCVDEALPRRIVGRQIAAILRRQDRYVQLDLIQLLYGVLHQVLRDKCMLLVFLRGSCLLIPFLWAEVLNQEVHLPFIVLFGNSSNAPLVTP